MNTYCAFCKALSTLNYIRKLEVRDLTFSKPDLLGPKMRPFLPLAGNPGTSKQVTLSQFWGRPAGADNPLCSQGSEEETDFGRSIFRAFQTCWLRGFWRLGKREWGSDGRRNPAKLLAPKAILLSTRPPLGAPMPGNSGGRVEAEGLHTVH